MQAPRTRFILNPNAGDKGGFQINPSTVDDVRDAIRRAGLSGEILESESEDEARALAADAARCGFDLVVAAGGDGTVGAVARELLDTPTALGIIPLGSVMNIARMLDIPRDLDGALAVLRDGAPRSIDVGQVNGDVFFECASVGLNAAVFREVQRFDDGQRRSILAALWVALRYRPARMLIRLDDEMIRTRALMVSIANGPYTGIGFTVAPDADLDDGLFDVTIFRRFSRSGLFLHLARNALGRRHYSPRVLTCRSSRVTIDTVHPLPARADSHDLGTTPVTFSVRRAALRVMAPRG
jgi:diacylglycerol kinase (ATP)